MVKFAYTTGQTVEAGEVVTFEGLGTAHVTSVIPPLSPEAREQGLYPGGAVMIESVDGKVMEVTPAGVEYLVFVQRSNQ